MAQVIGLIALGAGFVILGMGFQEWLSSRRSVRFAEIERIKANWMRRLDEELRHTARLQAKLDDCREGKS